ncbi:MAG: NUDIX domain-containing protein [Haloarculaceae archaeon]
MDEVAVVTCFLRNRGAVLLVRRSEDVGSYRGRWGAVAGHAEGDPDAAAREEIREETGLLDAVELVRAGEPFAVEDPDLSHDGSDGTRWVVHPYLFDCASRTVSTNYEAVEHEWVPPTEILRRRTVPDLWESYRRVRPTAQTVREDRDHGAAYLSLRALEALRDHAAERSEDAIGASGEGRSGSRAAERSEGGDDWAALASLACDLLAARPSMAVVRNRVNRAMAAASDARSPAAVERAASDGVERAFAADERAAAAVADRLSGTVLTLSRSGTVRAALAAADLDEVLVAESRPGGEGVGVAEALAAETDTTLLPDAAVAHALAACEVDAVLVGADTVLSDGRLVNKVGTRAAALAAAHEDVPAYAVAARDKVGVDAGADLEPLDRAAVYGGDAPLDVLAPTFDVTPTDLVELVTEAGVLSADDVAAVVDEHRALAGWQD